MKFTIVLAPFVIQNQSMVIFSRLSHCLPFRQGRSCWALRKINKGITVLPFMGHASLNIICDSDQKKKQTLTLTSYNDQVERS